MDLLLKNAKGTHDVRINIAELVSVKGVVFVVDQLSQVPPFIKLQPANAAQVQRYLKENEPEPERETFLERKERSEDQHEPEDDGSSEN